MDEKMKVSSTKYCVLSKMRTLEVSARVPIGCRRCARPRVVARSGLRESREGARCRVARLFGGAEERGHCAIGSDRVGATSRSLVETCGFEIRHREDRRRARARVADRDLEVRERPGIVTACLEHAAEAVVRHGILHVQPE